MPAKVPATSFTWNARAVPRPWAATPAEKPRPRQSERVALRYTRGRLAHHFQHPRAREQNAEEEQHVAPRLDSLIVQDVPPPRDRSSRDRSRTPVPESRASNEAQVLDRRGGA